MSGPKCKVCGATDRTEFSLFPKVEGYKFGEICVPCEAVALAKEAQT